jgi:hypothetical protein
MRLAPLAILGLALVMLVAAGCGALPSGGVSPGPSARATDVPPCRSDPHEGVHDPDRLKVLNPCATFVGTVVSTPKLNPSDGDVTFNVAPDPGYAAMLNEKNRSERGLHVEIVPMDQPDCEPGQSIEGYPEGNLGVCSGAKVVFPPRGAHVRVIGPHVYDSWVGWNEIHPTWQVELLSGSGPPLPLEMQQLKARLTGRAIGRKGALHGSGRVAITLALGKVCWRFTRLERIGRPTRATIRAGAAHRTGPLVLSLGNRYRARGCVAADAGQLESLSERPQLHYVAVVSARYRHGAVRGQLRPVPG